MVMRMWRGEAEGGEGRRGAQRQRVSRGAAEGSWAEDQKRQDVRVGRFTEQEKQTLKDAVRECARPPPPLLDCRRISHARILGAGATAADASLS